MRQKLRNFLTLILTFYPLTVILCSCVANYKPYMQEADKINKVTCKELKDQYNIDCIGLGFGMCQEPGIVQDLYIRLNANGLLDQKGARKLVLNTIDVYLNNIRANQKFTEECAVEFFNEGNLDITIFMNDNGKKILQPYIETIWVVNGLLVYNVISIESGKEVWSRTEETIQEARQKVSRQLQTP